MKHVFQLLVPVCVLVFLSCSKAVSNIVPNKYALELATLESKGQLKQSERKDAFLSDLFQPFIKNTFQVGGFDHRLREIQSNWKIFEDLNFVIFCGSVAKSDIEICVFVWVLKESKGRYDTVYLQIGEKVEEGSEYPASIVPRNLNSSQAAELKSLKATLDSKSP